MKPFVKLAETRLPDGTLYSLHTHDGNFYLKFDDRDLMSTALTYSEMMLAEKGCASLLEQHPSRPKHPKVLIGGLGMGFTLKRTLELIGRPATVVVAELVEEIIDWNRTFLAEYNGPLLDDERTKIYHGDLFDCLKQGEATYDAILIDIDDTPDTLIVPENARLYTPGFLESLRDALRPGGCLAFWVGEPVPRFSKRLRKAGFRIEELPAKRHERSKRAAHCIYIAHKTR